MQLVAVWILFVKTAIKERVEGYVENLFYCFYYLNDFLVSRSTASLLHADINESFLRDIPEGCIDVDIN